MRTILVAMFVAAGITFVGTPGASAAPANGAVINDAAAITDPVDQVQHWRWGSSGHWRWGSHGGHWRWGSHGGHWRWGSHGGHWRWGSHGHWRWGSRW